MTDKQDTDGTLTTESKLRILFHSNSPWSATGYGNQTALFTPRIKALGYDIAISAFYGLDGGVLNWNGIPVFPKGISPYGTDIYGAHAKNFGADIVITLVDAWVMDPNGFPPGVKWVPWFPVDMDPLPPPVGLKVAQAWKRIVFSRHAERSVKETGLDCYYVPHGVDTRLFRPIPQNQARKALSWDDSRFIVGLAAANKGTPSRKAFTQNIEAFAALKKKHPDALLYLHTTPGAKGEFGGVNLPEFVNFVGLDLGKDVVFADPYGLAIGYDNKYMTNLYSALDVHLLASMGEGFGIPIVEAQACGCPVIVGDWTAMSELCFSGWKVGRDEADKWWTPLAAYQYVPRVGAIADRLEAAYRMKGNQDYRKRARDGALKYDADKVTEKYWKPVLAEIAGLVEADK